MTCFYRLGICECCIQINRPTNFSTRFDLSKKVFFSGSLRCVSHGQDTIMFHSQHLVYFAVAPSGGH